VGGAGVLAATDLSEGSRAALRWTAANLLQCCTTICWLPFMHAVTLLDMVAAVLHFLQKDAIACPADLLSAVGGKFCFQ